MAKPRAWWLAARAPVLDVAWRPVLQYGGCLGVRGGAAGVVGWVRGRRCWTRLGATYSMLGGCLGVRGEAAGVVGGCAGVGDGRGLSQRTPLWVGVLESVAEQRGTLEAWVGLTFTVAWALPLGCADQAAARCFDRRNRFVMEALR